MDTTKVTTTERQPKVEYWVSVPRFGNRDEYVGSTSYRISRKRYQHALAWAYTHPEEYVSWEDAHYYYTVDGERPKVIIRLEPSTSEGLMIDECEVPF